MTEFRLIPPGILFSEIQRRGAASTKQLKEHFGVDSASIRCSMAPLFAADAIWSVTSGKAFYYMVNTGVRGRPNPMAAIKAAQRGELAQCGHPLDFRGAMMKQVMVFNQVGWGWGDNGAREIVKAEERAKVVWSFDDDPEAVDLE